MVATLLDLDRLDPAQRARLQELAQREVRRRSLETYWAGQPGEGGMSPPQREFLGLLEGHDRRCMIKANKVGGSYHALAEGTAWSLGTHPVRPLHTPNVGLVLVPDLDHSYVDDICRTLRKLQPPGSLHERCRYSEDAGYLVGRRRGLLLANGSQWLFRSSHQDPQTLEGIYADWILINESPAQHCWGATMRAASMDAHTPIILCLTAVDDVRKSTPQVQWLKKVIRDPEAGWAELRIPLSVATCPHRTPESIAQQIATCPPWERAQRLHAEWEAEAIDRMLQGFSSERNLIEDQELPTWDLHEYGGGIGLCMDHGERPGHEVILLYAYYRELVGGEIGNLRQPPRWGSEWCVDVLDAYQSQGRTTVDQDALGVARMLQRNGLTLYHVTRAHGDTNSAGKSALTSVNEAFTLAFAKLLRLGWSQSPVQVEGASKGTGSVLYRARVLDSGFMRGRLRLRKALEPLITAVRGWRGTDKGEDSDLKHWIDALGYGVADLLDVTEEALLVGQVVGRG